MNIMDATKHLTLPKYTGTHCLSHERNRERDNTQKSESEMFLFDPYKKYILSNNETILDQGTSLVANIRAAYYIINFFFHITS